MSDSNESNKARSSISDRHLSPDLERAISDFRNIHLPAVRSALEEYAVFSIVTAAREVAPDAKYLHEALDVGKDEGTDVLTRVEDDIRFVFEKHPELTAVMRDSSEWDEDARASDPSRGALALINSALHTAETAWAVDFHDTPSL